MDKIQEKLDTLCNTMANMDAKMEKLMNELINVKENNVKLQEKVTKQERQIEWLEKENKRRNLIIKGIPDSEEEGKLQLSEKLKLVASTLNVAVDLDKDVDDIKRMGKYTSERSRPICLKLTTERKKHEIKSNSKNLKGQDIWIEEDYPRKVQEERKLLMPYLMAEKKKGKQVALIGNKLKINGTIYETKDLENRSRDQENTFRKTGKRTVEERSPQGDSLRQQLSKVTRTERSKND